MTTDSSYSRRRVLQLTGGLTTGALAGCLGFLSGSDPSVIENVTFDGTQMVVHLADETNADAIDLRSPSDEKLRTASVGRKSTVAFSLYKKQTIPYPPGKYTLVAVDTSGDEPQTLTTHSLELTSSFEVTNVRPIEKDLTNNFGANTPPVASTVRVTLQNTGDLPVGITYIGFPKGVPSPNDPPSAFPQGIYPQTGPKVIAGGAQTTLEPLGPLLRYVQPFGQSPDQAAVGVPNQSASWQQIKANQCTGDQQTATLLIATANGATYTTSVTFKYGGQAFRHDAGSLNYACSNVTVVDGPTNTRTTTPRS